MAYVYKRDESPFYQACITVDGRSVRFSTKVRVRAQAEKIADDREVEENKRLESQSTITLIEASAAFLRKKSRNGTLKKTSEENYRQSLKNVYGILGDFPLGSLSELKLRSYIKARREAIAEAQEKRFLKALEKAKAAGKTLERPRVVPSGDPALIKDFAFLSSLWTETAIDNLEIGPNWIKDVKWGLKKADEKKTFLLPKEVDRLLSACTKLYQRLFIMLSVDCGTRKRETLSLRWDEIDLDEGLITFRGKLRTKTGEPRFIPLTERCRNALLHTKQEQERQRQIVLRNSSEEFVFPGSEEGTHLDNVKTFWKNVTAKTGLKGTRIHDLRHTFASWAKQGGMQDSTVQAILGHATESMTKRYAHPSKEQLIRAIQGFEKTTNYTVHYTGAHQQEATVGDGAGKTDEIQEVGGAACVTRTRDPIITNDVEFDRILRLTPWTK